MNAGPILLSAAALAGGAALLWARSAEASQAPDRGPSLPDYMPAAGPTSSPDGLFPVNPTANWRDLLSPKPQSTPAPPSPSTPAKSQDHDWTGATRPGCTAPPKAPKWSWTGAGTFTGDLDALHPAFRTKVEQLLAAVSQRKSKLTGQRFRPKVHTSWRTTQYQRDLKTRGRSTVDYSYHNVTTPCGAPQSLAADIIERSMAWDKYTSGPHAGRGKADVHGFWDALGEEARKLGLEAGHYWRSFPDSAHVQLYPSSSNALTQLVRGQWPPPQINAYAGVSFPNAASNYNFTPLIAGC